MFKAQPMNENARPGEAERLMNRCIATSTSYITCTVDLGGKKLQDVSAVTLYIAVT